jgi:hypothetical protein
VDGLFGSWLDSPEEWANFWAMLGMVGASLVILAATASVIVWLRNR